VVLCFWQKNEDGERCVSKKSNGGGVFMEFNGNSLKEVSQVPSYSLVSEVSHGNSKSGGSSGSSLLRVEIQNQPQPPHPSQQNSRKQRRSWSSELHRRFVDALQQLGGAHGKLFVFRLVIFIVQIDQFCGVLDLFWCRNFLSLIFWIWEYSLTLQFGIEIVVGGSDLDSLQLGNMWIMCS
jgi:hypothetical protein